MISYIIKSYINPITLECSDRVLRLLIYNYKIMKKIYVCVLENYSDEMLANSLYIECYEHILDAVADYCQWVDRIGCRGRQLTAYGCVKHLCVFKNIDGSEGRLRVIERLLH